MMATSDEKTPTSAGKAPRAVALRYDEKAAPAPTVVASGLGEVARHIMKVAEEHGVPVREDPDLVSLLAGCDLGEEIPVELYEAVAVLLSFLYRVNESLR